MPPFFNLVALSVIGLALALAASAKVFRVGLNVNLREKNLNENDIEVLLAPPSPTEAPSPNRPPYILPRPIYHHHGAFYGPVVPVGPGQHQRHLLAAAPKSPKNAVSASSGAARLNGPPPPRNTLKSALPVPKASKGQVPVVQTAKAVSLQNLKVPKPIGPVPVPVALPPRVLAVPQAPVASPSPTLPQDQGAPEATASQTVDGDSEEVDENQPKLPPGAYLHAVPLTPPDTLEPSRSKLRAKRYLSNAGYDDNDESASIPSYKFDNPSKEFADEESRRSEIEVATQEQVLSEPLASTVGEEDVVVPKYSEVNVEPVTQEPIPIESNIRDEGGLPGLPFYPEPKPTEIDLNEETVRANEPGTREPVSDEEIGIQFLTKSHDGNGENAEHFGQDIGNEALPIARNEDGTTEKPQEAPFSSNFEPMNQKPISIESNIQGEPRLAEEPITTDSNPRNEEKPSSSAERVTGESSMTDLNLWNVETRSSNFEPVKQEPTPNIQREGGLELGLETVRPEIEISFTPEPKPTEIDLNEETLSANEPVSREPVSDEEIGIQFLTKSHDGSPVDLNLRNGENTEHFGQDLGNEALAKSQDGAPDESTFQASIVRNDQEFTEKPQDAPFSSNVDPVSQESITTDSNLSNDETPSSNVEPISTNLNPGNEEASLETVTHEPIPNIIGLEPGLETVPAEVEIAFTPEPKPTERFANIRDEEMPSLNVVEPTIREPIPIESNISSEGGFTEEPITTELNLRNQDAPISNVEPTSNNLNIGNEEMGGPNVGNAPQSPSEPNVNEAPEPTESPVDASVEPLPTLFSPPRNRRRRNLIFEDELNQVVEDVPTTPSSFGSVALDAIMADHASGEERLLEVLQTMKVGSEPAFETVRPKVELITQQPIPKEIASALSNAIAREGVHGPTYMEVNVPSEQNQETLVRDWQRKLFTVPSREQLIRSSEQREERRRNGELREEITAKLEPKPEATGLEEALAVKARHVAPHTAEISAEQPIPSEYEDWQGTLETIEQSRVQSLEERRRNGELRQVITAKLEPKPESPQEDKLTIETRHIASQGDEEGSGLETSRPEVYLEPEAPETQEPIPNEWNIVGDGGLAEEELGAKTGRSEFETELNLGNEELNIGNERPAELAFTPEPISAETDLNLRNRENTGPVAQEVGAEALEKSQENTFQGPITNIEEETTGKKSQESVTQEPVLIESNIPSQESNLGNELRAEVELAFTPQPISAEIDLNLRNGEHTEVGTEALVKFQNGAPEESTFQPPIFRNDKGTNEKLQEALFSSNSEPGTQEPILIEANIPGERGLTEEPIATGSNVQSEHALSSNAEAVTGEPISINLTPGSEETPSSNLEPVKRESTSNIVLETVRPEVGIALAPEPNPTESVANIRNEEMSSSNVAESLTQEPIANEPNILSEGGLSEESITADSNLRNEEMPSSNVETTSNNFKVGNQATFGSNLEPVTQEPTPNTFLEPGLETVRPEVEIAFTPELKPTKADANLRNEENVEPVAQVPVPIELNEEEMPGSNVEVATPGEVIGNWHKDGEVRSSEQREEKRRNGELREVITARLEPPRHDDHGDHQKTLAIETRHVGPHEEFLTRQKGTTRRRQQMLLNMKKKLKRLMRITQRF